MRSGMRLPPSSREFQLGRVKGSSMTNRVRMEGSVRGVSEDELTVARMTLHSLKQQNGGALGYEDVLALLVEFGRLRKQSTAKGIHSTNPPVPKSRHRPSAKGQCRMRESWESLVLA